MFCQLITAGDEADFLKRSRLDISFGDDADADGAIASTDAQPTVLTTTRAHQMLEPLWSLHSLASVSIKGPIDDQYKARVSAKLTGHPPGKNEQLSLLYKIYVMANDILKSSPTKRDTAQTIRLLTETQDKLYFLEFWRWGRANDPVETGPLAEFTFGDIYYATLFRLEKGLALANFESGNLTDAHRWVDRIVQLFVRQWPKKSLPTNSELAWTHKFRAQIHEAEDILEENHDIKVRHADSIVTALREAVNYSP